ncbi:MAG TPA: DEAD/DEAH box helicase [Longimicrobiales bacterium]|nr:DEAD/DEAH box helicase [Longimicrobiales bacterium]
MTAGLTTAANPPLFADLGLSQQLLAAVHDMGFTTPTPVQAKAIPAGLRGADILACAMTGSGKTAAFLLPILDRLRQQPRGRTRALILSPTRELAVQIHQHFTELARHTGVKGAAVYGGVGMKPQEDALRRGFDVIVATPGRLLDHMQYDYAKLADVDVLVLDEADRMLDMGFLPDIRRVLRQLPTGKRQTMLFSATLPAPIVQLARELLHEPVRVDVERKQAPAHGITQALYPVPATLKVTLLIALLERGEIGNAIIFCRTKHRANRLADKLVKHGLSTARIHGNRSQSQRTDALAGFKQGRYRVLVATDIVARGIDVEALEHVVNFDVPAAADDYIHRVGRTARAGAVGDAYTLVSPDEEGDVRNIERAVGHRIERRKLDGFDYHAREAERFEVPIGERIAEIRARKAEERVRARANAERRAQAPAARKAGGAEVSSGGAGNRRPRGRSGRNNGNQRTG